MPTESWSIRPDLFLKMSVIVLIVIDTSGINKDRKFVFSFAKNNYNYSKLCNNL